MNENFTLKTTPEIRKEVASTIKRANKASLLVFFFAFITVGALFTTALEVVCEAVGVDFRAVNVVSVSGIAALGVAIGIAKERFVTYLKYRM